MLRRALRKLKKPFSDVWRSMFDRFARAEACTYEQIPNYMTS